MVPKHYPFAISSTSRGCPFNCTFCSGWTVTGKKVRMRSAKHVLWEIDELYKKGIREIIYLDDHFFFDRKRAKEIMNGIIERKLDLTWKCVNVNISNLDEEMLTLMKKSGSYQIAVAIESGNKDVLKNMIKKPFINLEKTITTLDMAKKMGFEIVANFIIGYPKETWEQIRETFRYAEKINIDYAIFHIATPLPQTELMQMCIDEGLLPKDYNSELNEGFCKPIIDTSEFTSHELMILRTYEWDRINFYPEERKKRVASMTGITLEELEQWRKETRKKLGVGVV
jgi:anaerobic magnesium-protoporphyrin IX monomethyl ester cyclase